MRRTQARPQSFRSCGTSWRVASARIRSSSIRTNGCSRRSILSVLYCRHLDLLRRAFSLVPEYLRTPEQDKVRSGSDYGVQLGRRFRALKLWMIIRYFGHEGLAARIREHCRLAKLFASWVEESDEWELMAPLPFALVCFRACPKIEETLNRPRANRVWMS